MTTWVRAAALATAAAIAAPAAAETVSSKSSSALFRSQTAVLDGRAAQQYGAPRAEIPQGLGAPRFAGRYDGPFLDLARGAARRHGVPEDLSCGWCSRKAAGTRRRCRTRARSGSRS